MHVLGVMLLVLSALSLGSAGPVVPPLDTVIVQVQQWGVVGAHRVVDQVLLNGVSLTNASHDFDVIIRGIASDAHLPALASTNQTAALRNHTCLRSRECILEGQQLHWTDRVSCDGTVYLTLDHADVWTAHVPQAQALKELWDQEAERTRVERVRLQEGCIMLMRALGFSLEQPDPGSPLPLFMIPVLALLALAVLISISLLLSKKLGLRHPGGVIGSVIHYPQDMTEMAPGLKAGAYHAL